MVPVEIKTLVFAAAPAPSVIVLQPKEEPITDGKFRVVPIWVGTPEAAQLSMALNKTKFARPITHDLIIDAITNLDACVDHVLINGFKGNTFFSKLVLSQHGRLVELDARPSDSLALAIRQSAPIYIDEETLDKTSFPYIIRDKSLQDEETLQEFHDFIKGLSPDDFLEGGEE